MVLKKFFKRILPEVHQIREHKHLQIFGDILHDPHIFHLTRRSVAGGVATGLFVCFLPMPGHMILAALVAIKLRVNLPLAVILVWITNPVTMPPIFYLAYKLGNYIRMGWICHIKNWPLNFPGNGSAARLWTSGLPWCWAAWYSPRWPP